MKVYLIEVSHGSYDDYYSYITTGFFDKDKAQAYIDKYNSDLDKSRDYGAICNECRCGKYQYLSHVIINCPLKVKKSDITEIEKIDKDLYFECEKYIDGYDAYDSHYAAIVEIEIQ